MSKEELVASIKDNILNKYGISSSDIDTTYNFALGDYLRLKYPSDNNRPTYETYDIDFAISQWLQARMIDIIDRAGFSNLKSYSENGISLNYGASYIDQNLVGQIMPKASYPI
ncbi:MAG: hypothetical protein EOL95_09455 [Bacteroidia bacterium]|nr:hypothetical protein [Bacteroidia bacterium]